MELSQLPTRQQRRQPHAPAGQPRLAAGYARLERYDAPTVNTYSANWGYRLRDYATINANVSKVTGLPRRRQFGVTLQLPLDNQRFATASGAATGACRTPMWGSRSSPPTPMTSAGACWAAG